MSTKKFYVANSILKFLFQKRTVKFVGINDNLLSLRGFAAVSVLIFHAMLCFQVGGLDLEVFKMIEWTTPEHVINQFILFLTNGGSAVTFFFVHSGFVLTLSLNKRYTNNKSNIFLVSFSYYIRRVFRLYPVIIVSVIAGALFYYFIFENIASPPANKWLQGFFRRGVSGHEIMLNIFMVSQSLNKFLWSLLVETQLSVIMPLLYFALRYNISAILLFLTMGLFIYFEVGTALHNATIVGEGLWVFHKFIFMFVVCFLLGGLMTTIRDSTVLAMQNIEQTMPKFSQIVYKGRFPLCAAVLLLARPYSGLSMEYAVLFEALSAMTIVHIVYYRNDGWLQNLCSHPISRFYGRISYSLYMFSGICIYASAIIVLHLFGVDFIQDYGLFSNIAATVVSISIVTVVAALCYYLIELPFMKAGGGISNWLEARYQ